MWAKLDEALLDHRKVFTAGDLLGKNGPVVALGFYAIGLLYANKHLTEGFLPEAVVRRLRHADKPLEIADALVTAGLWERVDGGFRIHDYHDENGWVRSVLSRRKADRERKRIERGAAP